MPNLRRKIRRVDDTTKPLRTNSQRLAWQMKGWIDAAGNANTLDPRWVESLVEMVCQESQE